MEGIHPRSHTGRFTTPWSQSSIYATNALLLERRSLVTGTMKFCTVRAMVQLKYCHKRRGNHERSGEGFSRALRVQEPEASYPR